MKYMRRFQQELSIKWKLLDETKVIMADGNEMKESLQVNTSDICYKEIMGEIKYGMATENGNPGDGNQPNA